MNYNSSSNGNNKESPLSGSIIQNVAKAFIGLNFHRPALKGRVINFKLNPSGLKLNSAGQ